MPGPQVTRARASKPATLINNNNNQQPPHAKATIISDAPSQSHSIRRAFGFAMAWCFSMSGPSLAVLCRADRPRKRPLGFLYPRDRRETKTDLGRDRPHPRSTSGAARPNCRLRLSMPRREARGSKSQNQVTPQKSAGSSTPPGKVRCQLVVVMPKPFFCATTHTTTTNYNLLGGLIRSLRAGQP